MSTNRRKCRGEAVNSTQAWKRSRLPASSEGGPSTAEPTDLKENGVLSLDLGYGEHRRQRLLGSPVPNSDDEGETSDDSDESVSQLWTSPDEETAREWQPAVMCPICMDYFSEIVQSERQIMSTQCGHLFCSQCLPPVLSTSQACPTCRTNLLPWDYHPIFF